MIDIRDLSWSYPHAASPALRGLTLHIDVGEFVVLCGASGSGKSTALRLMNGLVPHFYNDGTLEGRVKIAAMVSTEMTLEEIGYDTGTVSQHPRRQFFTPTVGEELAFAMENFGFPPERIRAQVQTALSELSTEIRPQDALKNLSGGQQQQVAIASASVHGPKLMLLDEPSSNLSVDAIARLRLTLRALKNRGITIVIAEHRLSYLEDLLDRAIVMAAGSVEAEWTSAQLRTITDDTLARYGLRGTVDSADLPVRPAAGSSIVPAAPVHEVPSGALELTDVTCRAGGRRVLSIDRLTFPAARVSAILGPNGAGKTTLARVIAGLQAASGNIQYHGVTHRSYARRQNTALVMQDVQRQLFTETVSAEIAFAQSNRNSREDVLEILAALDLSHLTARHPLSLSGGQQQRVAFAAARATGRPIVIFDEPSSGVDRRHLISISEHIRQVAAGGAVVLLISHDEDLLARAADQQVTLTPLRKL